MEKEISNICLDFFENKLPPRGKPKIDKEWTVFSAIVQEELNSDSKSSMTWGTLSVVAAGTGTKCLGQSEKCSDGNLLHDSHSEVVAKRAFQLYLIENISIEKGVFVKCSQNGLLSLRPDVKFHFFSTCVPCGDASIFELEQKEKQEHQLKKGENLKQQQEPCSKRPKLDLHRTGAKCLPTEKVQDLHGPGLNYHTALGAIRTKPGRGEKSMSLSCSDKIFKWNYFGWQGSMLPLVLSGPIRIVSITICSPEFDRKAMERAMFLRFQENFEESSNEDKMILTHMEEMKIFHDSNSKFKFQKRKLLNPSPCSVIYSKFSDKIEVSVNGRKEGIVKKHLHTEKARVKICRRNINKKLMEKLTELINNCDKQSVKCDLLKLVVQKISGDFNGDCTTCPWYEKLQKRFYEIIPKWPQKDNLTKL